MLAILLASSAFLPQPQLAHGSRTAVLRRAPVVVASEEETNIFTLQPRDDGWNDVRDGINTFRKQREPSWNALNEKYIGPASEAAKVGWKWTKVLTNEVIEVLPDSVKTLPNKESLSGAVGSISVPKLPSKESLSGAVGRVVPTRKPAVAPPKPAEPEPAAPFWAFQKKPAAKPAPEPEPEPEPFWASLLKK